MTKVRELVLEKLWENLWRWGLSLLCADHMRKEEGEAPCGKLELGVKKKKGLWVVIENEVQEDICI